MRLLFWGHPFAVLGGFPYRRLSLGKTIDLQTAIVVRSVARTVPQKEGPMERDLFHCQEPFSFLPAV
jgi:hypothetical protein